ncbi:YHYH protein [Celeribacter sp.]|uniref:YHYH protein n=1 Tax=Celeribacter sp. TaxID=1890673 RepID=UPI003A90E3C6
MKYPATILVTLAFSAPAFASSSSDPLHNLEHFFEDAQIVSGPELVDCTLSEGAETTCFSITVKTEPTGYTPGPWCPTSVLDDADAGGIWLKDGEVHDVDGEFVSNLSRFYNDEEWQLVNPDGSIRVTDTKEACEAAARPDVAEEYQNYCVQCLPEYVDESATVTYVIPLTPQAATRPAPTNQSGSGVAYNGIRLDGSAPVDDILAAHTIAPFDDCGGHINTHVGYHYHAVTDCLEGGPVVEGHASQIGIAMDGYPIFNRTDAQGEVPDDLDACNGHVSDDLGYHYHAGEAGSNAILGCMTAQAGCVLEDPEAQCDASARPAPPRP